jgi:Aromatic-ring-opening dioxygenase LigAB, LigA subunit
VAVSVLSVNRLCRDIMRDPGLRARLQQDPKGALQSYPHALSDAERAALLAGDVGTLYRMGANSFLMGYLPRYGVFGLDVASYGERMRAVAD